MRSQPEALLCAIYYLSVTRQSLFVKRILTTFLVLRPSLPSFFGKTIVVIIILHGFNRTKEVTISDLTKEIVIRRSC